MTRVFKAFADREPTTLEVERLRLVLSTFQDGTGGLKRKDGTTLPDWRNFERSVAEVFGGAGQENKAIFDVLVPGRTRRQGSPIYYGISCKMRGELRRVNKDGRVTIELSNSSKAFWDRVAQKGIQNEEYVRRAGDIGAAVLECIEDWKRAVSVDNGGNVDLQKSCYLTLLWDARTGEYRMYWFDVALPDPSQFSWYFSVGKERTTEGGVGRLNGATEQGERVFEWYAFSGGQLKYYPLAKDARWASDRFKLEPLDTGKITCSLGAKAEKYFPVPWATAQDPPARSA